MHNFNTIIIIVLRTYLKGQLSENAQELKVMTSKHFTEHLTRKLSQIVGE